MEMKLLLLQLQVSAAVLFILILRQGIRKLPKLYSYALWLLVFARLLCPLSLESRISFMPSAEQGSAWVEQIWKGSFSEDTGYNTGNDLQIWDQGKIENSLGNVLREGNTLKSGYNMEKSTVRGTDQPDSESKSETKTGSENIFYDMFLYDPVIIKIILFSIWALGAAFILGRNGIALAEVKNRIKGAQKLEDGQKFAGRGRYSHCSDKNIYVCGEIKVPFTLGFIHPKIYLPITVEGEEREYIICHESVHIRRKDYIIKSAAFLLLALNWFNPFIWIAFRFMESDMEMSCDEKVVELMGSDIKRQYSQSLLDFAVDKGQMAVTPLNFGEDPVKQRVKNILMLKNAKKWSVIAGTIVIIAAGIFLFTTRSESAEADFPVKNSPAEDSPEKSAAGGDEPEKAGKSYKNEPEPAGDGSITKTGRLQDDQKNTDLKQADSQADNEEISDSKRQMDDPDGTDMDFGEVYREEGLTVYSTGQPEEVKVQFCENGIFRVDSDKYLCLYPYPVSPNVQSCSQDGILYFTMGTDSGEGSGEEMVDRICRLDVESGEYDSETLKIADNPVKASDIRMLDVRSGYVLVNKSEEDICIPLVNTGDISSSFSGNRWKDKTVTELVSDLNEEELNAYGAAVRDHLLNHQGVPLNLSDRMPDETYAVIDLDGDGEAEKITLSRDPSGESGYFKYDAYQLQAGDSRLTGYSDRISNNIWAFGIDDSKILLALNAEDSGGDPETILFSYENEEIKEIGRLYDDLYYCSIGDGTIESSMMIYDVIMPMSLKIYFRINEQGMLEQEPQNIYEINEFYSRDGELLVSLPVHDSPDGEVIRYMDPQAVEFKMIDKTYHWIYLEGENGEGGWFQTDGDKGERITELDMNSEEVFALYYAG